MKFSSARATARKIPSITPSRATPAKHTIDRANSVLRTRHSLWTPATSSSPMAAVITTAASAELGRSRTRFGKKSSMSAISTAPTTPVSWVLAPAASATGVREELLLTEKPWKKPAATLAAPSATSSWFGSTR